MATTHVFIVDEKTFPIHLQYMFAGTGRGKDLAKSIFDINNEGKGYHIGHVNFSLLNDISRCRIGDLVVFYLQSKALFFGVFKIKNTPYINNNNEEASRVLSEKLSFLLPFRVDIEPHVVYPKGISEWELLDSISDVEAPYKMQWSLIYRKLKGKRGCTMITLYEAERLIYKLSVLNNESPITDFNHLTYKDSVIVNFDDYMQLPQEKYKFNFVPKIIEKYNSNLSYEILLQGLILQNIGKGTIESLDGVFLQNKSLNWIGNEVICSVGKQAMDILLDTNVDTNENNRIIIPIEIKDELVEEPVLEQISKYIKWLNEYYIPNIREGNIKEGIVRIEAIILSLKEIDVDENKKPNRDGYKKFKKALDSLNGKFGNAVRIKHVVYCIDNGNIVFQNM